MVGTRGGCKAGMKTSYQGDWGYHPLRRSRSVLFRSRRTSRPQQYIATIEAISVSKLGSGAGVNKNACGWPPKNPLPTICPASLIARPAPNAQPDDDSINEFKSTGASFDILDATTHSGVFSSISLPALSGSLQWNTSQLYTSGVLSVAAPGVGAARRVQRPTAPSHIVPHRTAARSEPRLRGPIRRGRTARHRTSAGSAPSRRLRSRRDLGRGDRSPRRRRPVDILEIPANIAPDRPGYG